MEKIKKNILFSKSGGTASKNAKIARLTIPVQFLNNLKISPDEKEVYIYTENNKIIIEKA